MSNGTPEQLPSVNVGTRWASVACLVAYSVYGVVVLFTSTLPPLRLLSLVTMGLLGLLLIGVLTWWQFWVSVTVTDTSVVIRNYTSRREIARSTIVEVVAQGLRMAHEMRVVIVVDSGRRHFVRAYETNSTRLATDRARGLAAVLAVPHSVSDRRGPIRWN